MRDRPWARSIRGPGGDSDALLQAAAHLYQLAGRFDLALAILLRLRQPDAFDFITQHGLLPLLRSAHIAALVRIDEASFQNAPSQHFLLLLQQKQRNLLQEGGG